LTDPPSATPLLVVSTERPSARIFINKSRAFTVYGVQSDREMTADIMDRPVKPRKIKATI